MTDLEKEQKYQEWLKQPLTRELLAKCGIFKRTRRPRRKCSIILMNKQYRKHNKELWLSFKRSGYYKGDFNRINGVMELNHS